MEVWLEGQILLDRVAIVTSIVRLLMIQLLLTGCTMAHGMGIITSQPYPTKWQLQKTCSRMFTDINMTECGTQCLVRPGRCRLVAYDRALRWCHLCSNWVSENVEAEIPGKLIAVSNISTWNQDLSGPCANRHCPSPLTQACLERQGNVFCVTETECGPPVEIPFGDPSWSRHREVGVRIRYTCVSGNRPVRGINPYSECLDNGTWSAINDGLCVCKTPGEGLALNKPTTQSSINHRNMSGRAVDGDKNQIYYGGSCTHTLKTLTNPWWKVDLKDVYCIRKVVIYNRADCCGSRLSGVRVTVSVEEDGDVQLCIVYAGPAADGEIVHMQCDNVVKGRWLKLELIKEHILTLCEVEVY